MMVRLAATAYNYLNNAITAYITCCEGCGHNPMDL